jgi:hypothetical protein
MHESMTTAGNVALLAPVPLEHLIDALAIMSNQRKVAFGSRDWETFRELDSLRKGLPVDTYIYESHGEGRFDFNVSWRARYIGHVESDLGAHPAGMKYRPASTCKYANDNSGHWAVFWELNHLERIPEQDRIHVGDFTGYGQKKAYGHSFSPRGPLLVEHP